MNETVTCPLCGHEIPKHLLSQHRLREDQETIRHTLNLIKEKHPDWVEENGACQKCWERYKNL